ncbi:MAG: lysophospholipase [Bryobacteraceae bacterium]|nr:lysophospholipase [Bryobacteraceae bacterium]
MKTLASVLFASACLAAVPARQDFEVAAPGGVALKASHWSGGKPGPAILLLHMCAPKASRLDWEPLAVRLADAGFQVFAYDHRSFGESGGERNGSRSLEEMFGIWRGSWLADTEAVFNSLQKRPGVQPARLGLAGASCGSFLSIAFAEKHAGRVKAMALLSGPVDEPGLAFLGQANIPVLMTASAEDGPTSKWARSIAAKAKHPASALALYDGAGHGTNMFAKQPELLDKIVQMFRAQVR